MESSLDTDPWHNTKDRHDEHAALLAAVHEGDAACAAGLAKSFFDRWSTGYSKRMAHWGYDAPSRIAKLLLSHGYEHKAGGILDAGAGDGLSGLGLRTCGLDSTPMTAVDISPSMLALAAGSGAYSKIVEADLAQPLPFDAQAFDAVACVGVLTYLSPASGVLSEFARVTRAGGLVCFNLRTDQLATWEPTLDELAKGGVWHLVERLGPFSYLPGDPRYAETVLAVAFAFQMPAASSNL